MTTITKTTAQAVSRKLASIGFESYDRWDEIGYSVHMDGDSITVANWTHSPGTAAVELASAGYLIEGLQTSEGSFTGRHMELFTVVGKVGA